MKKQLLTLLFLTVTSFIFSQESCTYGTVTNNSDNAENMSTGGSVEYQGAADFDVPFGTIMTVDHITCNVLKGPADLQYVNVAFLQEVNGLPGTIIQDYGQLVPTTQIQAYTIADSHLQPYQISIDLPTPLVFQKGKYFLQLSASAGDSAQAWWEITTEAQTYGVFDYIKVNDELWGGAGYYNKVFQILGSCADSGEIQPEYGTVCSQENASNEHESGINFVAGGVLASIADDFIVPENTTFTMTDFTMHTMLLGPGLDNATINIRTSIDDAPGNILHSFIHKGPAYEQYDGYFPFPGSPYDVVAIAINFSFKEQPIVLTTGTYFIEVIPTPSATEFISWEITSATGSGAYSYTSYDQGTTWQSNNGYNQVFNIGGYCSTTLSTNTPQKESILNYYPNPVKEILNIKSNSRISEVNIYTIDGREVANYTFTDGEINMQSLPSSLYIVKVQLENGNFETLKVIKE